MTIKDKSEFSGQNSLNSSLDIVKIYLKSNSEVMKDFFSHQQKILDSLDRLPQPLVSPKIYSDIIKSNKMAVKDFLKSQKLAINLAADNPASSGPSYSLNSLSPSLQEDSQRFIQTDRSAENAIDPDAITAWLCESISELVDIPLSSISVESKFTSELGIDSLRILELYEQFLEKFPELTNYNLDPTSIECIQDIIVLLENHPTKETESGKNKDDLSTEIKFRLLDNISELMNIKKDLIKDDTRFDSDLDIDSLKLVEIFDELQSEYPELSRFSGEIVNINSIADIDKIFSAATDTAEIDIQESFLPPGHENLLHDIRDEIAARHNLNPDEINYSDSFSKDINLNLLEVSASYEKLYLKHDLLRLVGQELTNCDSLEEIKILLSRFDLSQDKMGGDVVQRYLLTEKTRGKPLGENLPEKLAIFGVNTPEFEKFCAQLKSNGISLMQIEVDDETWHFIDSDKQVKLCETEDLKNQLKTAASQGILPPCLFLSLDGSDSACTSEQDWESILKVSGLGFFALAKALSQLEKDGMIVPAIGVLGKKENAAAWSSAIGVAKSFAREITNTTVRSGYLLNTGLDDVSPLVILEALLTGESAHNLRIANNSIIEYEIKKSVLKKTFSNSRVRLTDKSVLLISGGGCGISAEIAKMTAKKYGCHIAALGRTQYDPTSNYLEMSADNEIKKAITEEYEKKHSFTIDPELLNKRRRLISRQKEIFNTAREIMETSGSFSYHQVDVTSYPGYKNVLNHIRKNYGRINGLIHGAGIIRDSLAFGKSYSDFLEVFYTKAMSAFNLFSLTKDEPLEFAYFFSSLSSYAGTAGQTDYVGGNEVLNQLAAHWNQLVSYPVKSILWSVWSETGLAGPAILNSMKRMGLKGITTKEGINLFHDEMRYGQKSDDWVLLAPPSTLQFTIGHK